MGGASSAAPKRSCEPARAEFWIVLEIIMGLLQLFGAVLLVLSVLTLRTAGSERGLLSLSEGELVNSHLWKDDGENLFLIKGGDNTVPEEAVSAVVRSLEDLPVTAAEVMCGEEGADELGDVCSLFTRHQVLVKRGGGVGGPAPFSKYKDVTAFLNAVLELLMGEALVRVDSHKSLVTSLAATPESLMAVLLTPNSPEYTELLRSYLTLGLSMPVVVTNSKETLPLVHRPPSSSREPPLYLYIVREAGKEWYRLFSLKQIKDFLMRARHPVIVQLGAGEGIKEYQRAPQLHLAVFFSGLPGFDSLDLEELVGMIAQKLYPNYIFVLADRKRNSDVAKKYSLTNDHHFPQVIVLPNGKDKESLVFEIPGESLETEATEVMGLLVSIHQDTLHQQQTEEVLAEGEAPGISVTELRAIERFKETHNLVVSFCAKGLIECPGDAYVFLKDARKTILMHNLDISYKFFAVECNSVQDVQKYELHSLPAIALYNRSRQAWRAGYQGAVKPHDVLSLIAAETGHSKLLQPLPTPKTEVPGLQLPPYHSHNLQQKRRDDDVYHLLGYTIPPPSLSSDLILTDKNFKERIMSFDKTAVLFYLQWSVESKLLLHHLMAAQERLDASQNVSLASLDCHAHTTLCYQYHVTVLPALLLFTPDTLDTPSPPPPSVGVLDSTHILRALGQSLEESGDGLIEATPASLPVLLRNKLTTPLILWCAEDQESSELASEFSEVALSNSMDLSFAWINSSQHSDLLHSVLTSDGSGFPAVVAMQLSQSAVYQMEPFHQLQADSFREQLLTFIQRLRDGDLEPTKRLADRKWPPLHPPFRFPSLANAPEDMALKMRGRGGDHGAFEVREEMDLSSIPHEELPQPREFPMFEDNSHEQAMGTDSLGMGPQGGTERPGKEEL